VIADIIQNSAFHSDKADRDELLLGAIAIKAAMKVTKVL
jgi:hypothetical protein